jgi:hypothetical protein
MAVIGFATSERRRLTFDAVKRFVVGNVVVALTNSELDVLKNVIF